MRIPNLVWWVEAEWSNSVEVQEETDSRRCVDTFLDVFNVDFMAAPFTPPTTDASNYANLALLKNWKTAEENEAHMCSF